MAQPDRFDLEQALMDCWHTATDIKLVADSALDNETATLDSVSNALIGLAELHNLRMAKAWDVFEALVARNELD